MPTHRELRLLSYFAAIAQAGSIRGAAERLSLSPAVVSEALGELEERLGVTLLKRSTRAMALTPAGERVLEAADAMNQAADAALEAGAAAATAPRGVVRVTAPVELCLNWLPEAIRRFEAAHPEARVEVGASDDIVDLALGGFDIGVRAYFARPDAPQPGDGPPLELVCAPSLIDADDPSFDARLARIGFIGAPDAGEATRRISSRSAAGVSTATAPVRIAIRNHVAAYRLALQGMGAALSMRTTVAEDLAAGRLVSLAPDRDFGGVDIRIDMRDRRPTAAARAFRDALGRSPISGRAETA